MKEKDFFPELTDQDLENLPPLPLYEMRENICIRCNELYMSEHRQTTYGWKRIQFSCGSCRRKAITIVFYNVAPFK